MIELKLVKKTDRRYQDIRNRHYIPNRGQIGQQLHYLIYDDNDLAGIISGASAAYSVKPRDDFFGLSSDNMLRGVQLNGLVNNSVFRIEKTRPNLASQVLAMWRKQVAKDWEELYGARVAGFETFVIEERRTDMTDRIGNLYLADNWTRVGVTKGFAPTRTKLSEDRSVELSQPKEFIRTEPKIILCKKVMIGKRKKRKPLGFPTEYTSVWRDKGKMVEFGKKRKEFFGMKHAEEFMEF